MKDCHFRVSPVCVAKESDDVSTGVRDWKKGEATATATVGGVVRTQKSSMSMVDADWAGCPETPVSEWKCLNDEGSTPEHVAFDFDCGGQELLKDRIHCGSGGSVSGAGVPTTCKNLVDRCVYMWLCSFYCWKSSYDKIARGRSGDYVCCESRKRDLRVS